MLILLVVIVQIQQVFSQTGPGGVGDQSTNALWLRADDISGLTDGEALHVLWPDSSGNRHDASQATAASRPVYITDAINGNPAVRYDGEDDLLDNAHAYTARTGFIIYRVDSTLQQETDLGQLWGSYGEGAHVAVDARSDNLQGFSFDGTPVDVNRARYAIDGGSYSAFVSNDNNPAWTYNKWEMVAFEFEGDRPVSRQVLGSLYPSFDIGIHQFGGELAELVIYNTVLNDAQRIIVENYLSGKYDIDISASGKDHYAFEGTHPHDIAGIGREDASNIHSEAFSAQMIQVSNPTGLEDGEYLLFGHDNGSISSWTTVETPQAGNIRRLAREWRLDETGDAGGITFTLDTSLLPARDAGYTKFVLLVDEDGDFTSGTSALEMSSPGSDNFYQVDVADIDAGMHIAIGVADPTVRFANSTAEGHETSDDSIVVILNYTPLSDVTVDYFTTDGSATALEDYTAVASATATIGAGTSSDTIILQLVNDVIVENDEDLKVTLTNPSAGLSIGSPGEVTYTIHDDDNPRKVYFSAAASDGSEGTTPVEVTVQLTPSEFDPVNPTTVDYTVTGGTATGGGIDYTLADGTVTIPPLTISSTFTIDIVDDPLVELPETIEVSLLNPTNSNLSATEPVVFTYTINDNESSPSVQFGKISSGGDESASLVKVPVELSGISSLDVTVDYLVSGTATPGVDYDLIGSSITIHAGSLSDTITFNVTDDIVIESPETVVITLQDPPVNGVLGLVTEHIYTITDNDAEPGYSGPGGVGDSLINELWLAADRVAGLSDGDPLSIAWSDASGNGHDASQSTPGYRPAYETGEINGLPVIRFDGTDDYLDDAHSYNAKTVFAVYRVSSVLQDVSQLAQLWGNYDQGVQVSVDPRSGGNERGWSFDGNGDSKARYALFGEAYTAGYYEDDNSVQWSYDQYQLVAVDFESTRNITRQVIGSLVPSLPVGDHQFGGDLAELIVYNKALNNAQKILVENYLAAKYSLDISGADIDYYAHEATHGFDVAGIGRKDADNLHLAGQSAGIIKVSDPSDAGNGEYLIFGHDNAATGAWTDTESPADSVKRIAREWRFDKTGDPGEVTISLDINSLPPLPDGHAGYGLLLDGDGDFSAGSMYVPLTLTGDNYEATLVDISDGDYLTIAVLGSRVNFQVAGSEFGESAGVVPVLIECSEVLSGDLTVDFAVSGGTATQGAEDDYTISPSPVTISAGTTGDTVFITLNNDSETESSETIVIDITGTSAEASTGHRLQHTLTIVDDDFEGYQGPGGVGDSTINTLWLKADGLSLNDGDPVMIWPDTSGNDHDAVNLAPGQEPDYVANVINSGPAVRFDDANNEYLGANVSLGIAGAGASTVFLVARNTESSDEDNTGLYIGDLDADGSDIRHYGIEFNAAVRFNNGNREFDDGFTEGDWKLGTYRNFAEAQYGQFEFFGNGAEGTQIASSGTTNVPVTIDDLYYIGAGRLNGSMRDSRYFKGDLAEVIAYNTYLNEAQRIIVENYLAARYSPDISISNDHYAFDATHGHDVAGIGRVDAANLHTMAQSAGVISIGSASDLGDSEYLLFGHDGSGSGTWVASEIPGDSARRISREWRLDMAGDVGDVTIALDTSRLPVKPGGYGEYVLWLDPDGDFSSGATLVNLEKTATGYAASGVDFSDGDYLTVGIIKPVIEFSLDASSGDESETPVALTVSLNYTLSTDAVAGYRGDGSGSASGGGIDFTLDPGTITIPAGTLSGDIPLLIHDDIDPETDETVVVKLDSAGTGITVGPDSIHTYTIHDNDNAREIDFTLEASSGEESVTPVFLTIGLNQPDPLNPTSVEYAVTGGTAVNGTDYTLAEGTAVVPPTEISTTVQIDVHDDAIYEPDETIVVALSNPINANLGEYHNHTYTILNDDARPTIEFVSASSAGSEAVSPAGIAVGLSAPAGENVTVDYSVTGGTATGGGVDYTLPDGTLVISAGDTLDYIIFDLVDDSEVEIEETIELLLSNESSNAVLGAQNSATFTINNNDYTGFTGPGGVGDSGFNKLWLSADTLVSSSGSDVMTWGDASGNANHALNLAPGQEPDLIVGQLNGLDVVRFDDHGGEDGDYLGANLSLGISGSGPSTVFIVAKNTTASDEDNTGLFIGQSPGSDGTVRHYGIEYAHAVRFNNGNRRFDDGFTRDNWRIGMTRNMSGYQYGQYEGYIDGVMLGQTASSGSANIPSTADDFYYLGAGLSSGTEFSSSRYFNGDMAEVIVYNTYLNEAQRIILENYLSSKYGLPVASDHYPYDVHHGHDVAGIGREDAANIHAAAQSAGILRFSNAIDLDNSEYLLFGHDNGRYDTWTTTEVPGTNLQRINREWRVSLTGDVGSVTAVVDTTLLEGKPATYGSLMLMVDSNGDFTSGATFYPLEISNGAYRSSGVMLNDGDYVTVAVARIEADFTLPSSNGPEGISPVSVNVELNYQLLSDYSIDYIVSGGTATGGGVDYTLADGTVTIPSGDLSGSINISIVDDVTVEPDETIILQLSNPSTGYIGQDTVHTRTINDNDNPRTVYFATSDSAHDESLSPILIKVLLSNSNPVEDSKIAYEVTGGDATGGGVDYMLPPDTLVIEQGDTVGYISLQVTDDLLDEADEGIIVELVGTGSLNLNLGSGTVFYDTIRDNDPSPAIQFDAESSSGAESFQTVNLTVELAAESGLDVEVDYDVTGGSATSGIDYNLPAGTLTIPAGSTSGMIQFDVIDDTDEEPTESVMVTLSNPVNAVLGGNSTISYNILDDDGLGYEGPGGVANFSTQNKVWLNSTYAPALSDGDPVSVWEDRTGNNHDATQSGTARPTYLDNGADNWNERPVVRFDYGFSQYLGIANHTDLNTGGPYDKKTIIVAFRTGTDINTRQVLYEQGGTVRGLNIYVEDGHLYISGWNEEDDDDGATTPWSFTAVTSPVSPNTPYFAMLQFNFEGAVGDVSGWLNGDTINILPGAGRLFNHPGEIGLGGMNNGSVFHDSPDGGYDHFYNGNISELIINNIVYNRAQIDIVNNYLGAKYNIPVTNDYYDHETEYGWEVFGIGQFDSDNAHTISQGTGMIRIDNPDNMDDGDYLLIGHDNGDIASWTSADVPGEDPNFRRISRVWRADDRYNGIGTIRLGLDDSQLPVKPFGFTKYVLLINDLAPFATGSEVIELAYNSSTGLYEATGIELSGDKFFTIGVVKPALEFSTVSSNGSEPVTPVEIEVALNYRTSSDVTVDYEVTGGTATNGDDYNLPAGTATVFAGQQTGSFQMDIVNDTDVEPDETVVISLSDPMSGLVLGDNDTHTYTINDDDNPRWVQFVKQDSANLESVDNIVVQVHINDIDTVNATSVVFTATGGTATGGGVDYGLDPDTVVIAAGDSLGAFKLGINDDILNETDETVIITLSAPDNANLGDTTQYTYTILDDDAAPTVEFETLSSQGSESFSPVRLNVSVSSASGQDITLYYSASGGTAINGGIDYTIINPSHITIEAGSMLDSLEFSVFNDIIEEPDETVIVTLDSVTNASLGAWRDHTYTIYDDDGMGWLGPGGVSDDGGYDAWLKSNVVSGYGDGARLDTWADVSVAGNDGTASGTGPYYYDNAGENVNNRPVVYYPGDNEYHEIANNVDFNTGGPYTRKTIMTVFRTGGNVTTRQVVYEQGGGTRGLNIYIEGGQLFIGGWNLANDDDGATTPWGFSEVNTAIGPNETHYAMLEFNADSSWMRGFLDGTLLGTLTGVGRLFDHPGDVGLGAMNDGSYFGSTAESGDGHYFEGKIMEFLSFNRTLNEARKIIIENYFGAKYDIAISNDRYGYEAGYDYEVFGIGRESSGHSHIIAQGSGIIRFDNPSDVDDGDYLFAGHDNGDITSWTTGEIPFDSIRRVAREWRVGETGEIGTIRFSVDTTLFEANPENYESFILMIDRDGDSDFTTGSVDFFKLDQQFGELVRTTNIGFNDGDVFTIGVARNISVQTGDWNNDDTWLLGVPQEDEGVVIVPSHVVTLTNDESIGYLHISSGAELRLGANTLSVTEGTIQNAGIFSAETGTIEYASNGSQCIAPLTYYNLYLSGTGTKTLCGNVVVQNDIQILGTPGTLFLDADPVNDYNITLGGDWRSRGTFLPRQGEVVLNGSSSQQMLRDDGGEEDFYDLTINTSGSLTINHDVSVGGTLIMNGGNIDMGANTLYIGSGTGQTGDLVRNTGSVVGEVQRWFSATTDDGMIKEFPVGTGSYYRPLFISFDDVSNGGTVAARFVEADPGSSGLPVEESGVNIHAAYQDGYWPAGSASGFSFTGNYYLKLVADGFTGAPLDTATRIISRSSSAADWQLVGFHENAVDTLIQRTNLSSSLYEYGIGSTAECEVNLSDCPADIIVGNDAGDCGALVSWTPPAPSGTCSGVTMTSTSDPGDFFPVGITTVTYYVQDAYGNRDSCSFDVTVSDDEDPVIIGCPTDINITSDTSFCGTFVTWTEPVAADNCPGVVLTSTHNPGDYFPVGISTVTYTATDAAGSTDICTFNVTVGDAAPPVISGPTEVCTPVQEAYSVADPGSHTFSWVVTNGTVSGSASNPEVSVDWTGTTQGTVEITITSGSGCTSTNSITVDKYATPVTGNINSSNSLTRR